MSLTTGCEQDKTGIIANIGPDVRLMPAISEKIQRDPSDYALSSGVKVFDCVMEDPYIEHLDAYNPGRKTEISIQESAFSRIAMLRGSTGEWHRRRGVAYDAKGREVKDPSKKVWGDPVLREDFSRFIGEDGSQNPGHLVWLSMLPHAKTLAYLSHPFSDDVITNLDGESALVDTGLREWWVSCTDARGIRNRAGVMRELIRGYAFEGTLGGLRTWSSVGSGTAAPVLESAVSLGLDPKMTLVDYDTTALEHAIGLASELDFKGQIEKIEANIFDLATLSGLPKSQVIDLMGIFEYIGDELRQIGIDITPEEFLGANYENLEPGGRLIFGQMRNDRPNSDFTMGVIGWPYIVQRSPAEVEEIVKKAGIKTAELSAYFPDDGVYGVYVIDKPRLGVGSTALL